MRVVSAALITLTMLPIVFLLYTPYTRAQSGDPCPGQGYIATSADAPIPIGVKVCSNDLRFLRGGCDFNPYPYLEGQKTFAGVQLTPVSVENTSAVLHPGIDPMLACRLAKLIQAIGAKGCQIKVTSAYRSVQEQHSICGAGRSGCAAAGNSCHQYGLAVDITSTCMAQLRTYLGTNNPSAIGAQEFKLHFPYYGNHIQCVEHARASCSPYTSSCGGLPSNPNLATIPSVAFGFSAGFSPNLSFAINQPVISGPDSMPIDEPYSPQQDVFAPHGALASMPTPISNQQSISSTTPATIIIAQSTRIPRRGTTLISWASVGTTPDSCTVTRNGIQFSTGNQGSKLFPAVLTGTAGTIIFVLDCTDFAGAHSTNSVSVIVQ